MVQAHGPTSLALITFCNAKIAKFGAQALHSCPHLSQVFANPGNPTNRTKLSGNQPEPGETRLKTPIWDLQIS